MTCAARRVDAGGVLWLTRDVFLSRAEARGITDRCRCAARSA